MKLSDIKEAGVLVRIVAPNNMLDGCLVSTFKPGHPIRAKVETPFELHGGLIFADYDVELVDPPEPTHVCKQKPAPKPKPNPYDECVGQPCVAPTQSANVDVDYLGPSTVRANTWWNGEGVTVSIREGDGTEQSINLDWFQWIAVKRAVKAVQKAESAQMRKELESF